MFSLVEVGEVEEFLGEREKKVCERERERERSSSSWGRGFLASRGEGLGKWLVLWWRSFRVRICCGGRT